MQGLLDSYRVALMDVFQVMAVDCYVPMDFYAPYYFVAVTTIVLLAATYCAHRALPWLNRTWFPHWATDTVKQARNMLLKTICIFMVCIFV